MSDNAPAPQYSPAPRIERDDEEIDALPVYRPGDRVAFMSFATPQDAGRDPGTRWLAIWQPSLAELERYLQMMFRMRADVDDFFLVSWQIEPWTLRILPVPLDDLHLPDEVEPVVRAVERHRVVLADVDRIRPVVGRSLKVGIEPSVEVSAHLAKVRCSVHFPDAEGKGPSKSFYAGGFTLAHLAWAHHHLWLGDAPIATHGIPSRWNLPHDGRPR